jgi:hypothetical protein
VQNEIKVMEYILNFANEGLRKYPTTLEMDEEILANGGLTEN